MNEMIERVAQAIMDEGGAPIVTSLPGGRLHTQVLVEPHEAARTAIEAMRPHIVRIVQTATVNMPPDLAASIVNAALP
jgi:hypothetical protein